MLAKEAERQNLEQMVVAGLDLWKEMTWVFVKVCPLIHQVQHSLKEAVHSVPVKPLVKNPLQEDPPTEFHQEVVQLVDLEKFQVEGTVVQH